MKKTKNLFLWVFIFLFYQVQAQVELLKPKETMPNSNVALVNDYLPKEKSLLWKIYGKGLEDTSYLYGTIHMIPEKDFFLTPATKKAVATTKQMTFEINMENMTDMGAQMALLSKAFMNGNTSLKDLVNPEEYTQIKTHFEENIGIPIFFLERVKPMFLTVLTDMDMSGGTMGGESMLSYEMELMKMAQKDRKKLDGLETAEFQMSMFDSIPYKAQAKMLVDALNASDEGSNQMEVMVKLYKDQDIQGMQTMFGEEEGGLEGYEDLLLTLRNKNWIPVMGEQMKAAPTFFAVGAGHLGGKTGVIALLREEGYRVEAIK